LFYAVRISTSVAILAEIFIQLVTFFKSYARKQKWMFFSEHSVYGDEIWFEDRFSPSDESDVTKYDTGSNIAPPRLPS